MKEISNTAKKIRKVLINFIDTELRKNTKKNNDILIDSKSSQELSQKYQQFTDYRMEIIETYNGNPTNDAFTSFNNDYHVIVSYSQLNNNFQVSYENKNFEKETSNDIVGKYVKDKIKDKKNISIRKSTFESETNSYHEAPADNKKKIVGNKKFNHKRRTLLSSVEIPQNVIMKFEENNSDNLNNKKVIDIENKINNKDKNETICANKKRKLKVNYYENKLKKYCSNLIIIKKRKIKKQFEVKSPPLKLKNKILKKNFSLNKENNKQIAETPKLKDSKTESKVLNSKNQHNKKPNPKSKDKLFKIQERKSAHKRTRAQSIKNINHILKTMKSLHKKNEKNEKNISPKKLQRQLVITGTQNDSKNKEIISQKIIRKEKEKNPEEIDVKKMTSGTVRSKRKMLGEKVSVKFSNKLFQMENKLNLAEQPRPNRKPLFKRANTINKMNNIFHFKGSEIKFKDN